MRSGKFYKTQGVHTSYKIIYYILNKISRFWMMNA